jgi:hypothetical protein
LKWLAKHTKIDYANGTTRLHRRFSWLPVYISGEYVWLCMYEVLQYFEVKIYTTTIETKEVNFKTGQWINLSKRIIE